MRDICWDIMRKDKGITCEDSYQLVSKKEDGLEAEFAVAKIEKVLEGRTKEIDDHRIVVALSAEPPDEGNTNTSCEGLVDLGFVFELGMLGLDGLEFDGDFFT